MSLLRDQAVMINRLTGTNSVNTLVAEECGELIQSVMKLQRSESGDKSLRIGSNKISINIDEEIADVLICIARLQDKLQNYDRVNFFINQKIDRTFDSIRNIVRSQDSSLDKERK